MTSRDGECLGESRVRELAAGDPAFGAPRATPGEAAHLARCPRCRARLAAHDPTALFGLLAALPETRPAPPRPRLPRRRASRGRRARRAAAGALAAAAALVAAAALMRPPAPAPPPWWLGGAPVLGSADAGVVRRVHSKTATVVTLLPPDGAGPPVTLIIDEEIDL